MRIANAWSDLPAAQALADLLTKEGMAARLVCCGNEEDTPAPQNHTRTSTVTLALWSPAATTSLWVLKETDAAAAAGVLVEALLSPPRPPAAKGRPPPIDLRTWRPGSRSAAWRALCRRLTLAAAGKSQTTMPLGLIAPVALGLAGGAYVLLSGGQAPSPEPTPSTIAASPMQGGTQTASTSFTPLEAPESAVFPEASGIGGPLIAVTPSPTLVQRSTPDDSPDAAQISPPAKQPAPPAIDPPALPDGPAPSPKS